MAVGDGNGDGSYDDSLILLVGRIPWGQTLRKVMKEGGFVTLCPSLTFLQSMKYSSYSTRPSQI